MGGIFRTAEVAMTVPQTVTGNGAAVSGTPAPVLRVRGVRRTYTAELAPVRALRGVDLEVADGEFVAVMGPSGCGKSTLLNVVAGLDTIDEGMIEAAGERVDGRNEDWLARFRRRHVGVVFQFFNLLDGVSALDNIVFPGILGGMRRKAAESRARDLLDLLGLGDRAEQVPAVLSGGQRQRLAIARALVNSPTLLLADEPTGALDSEGGLEVLELFRRLHADGQTIIMVTHSAEVAAGADRQVRMRDGRVVEDGPVPRPVGTAAAAGRDGEGRLPHPSPQPTSRRDHAGVDERVDGAAEPVPEILP
jgi:putative ABC transport system ATP-binding protein